MTLFAIVLVVASPLVYWLLRRRPRDRADAQPAEQSISPDIIADESGTATIEVEHGGEPSSPGELEVDGAEDATAVAETAQVDAVEVNSEPEVPNEPDNATYPE